jgi:beta-mannanase
MLTHHVFRPGLFLLPLLGLMIVTSSTPSAAQAQSAQAEHSRRSLAFVDHSIPPMIALGVYRPTFPNDMKSIDEYEQAAGASLPLIHWYALWGGWKSAFSRSDLERVEHRGSVPLITWEPWTGHADEPGWSLREAVLSGRHDSYIESWARGLAEYGHPVLLRFAHEMHQQAYPWAVGVNGNTAEEYQAAWRYVHDRFIHYGATNVQWVWNPNTLSDVSPEAHELLYRSLYPGDAYVDWVGLDIYNTGPDLDWGTPSWRSFADILKAPYQALVTITNRPIILPEMGCAEKGGSKAAWITDALTVQLPERFPRVRAVVWFDTNKEERWALDSSAQARAAWTAASGHLLAKF